MREPAAVRWGNTGKLASAGTLSPELATTYDIFPTILALANVSANGGGAGTAVLDGRDLSPMLFDVDGGNGRGRSLHECIMIYHSMAGGQKGALEQTGGVAAVRCGRYKAHFWTRSSVKPPACGQKPLPAPDGDQGVCVCVRVCVCMCVCMCVCVCVYVCVLCVREGEAQSKGRCVALILHAQRRAPRQPLWMRVKVSPSAAHRARPRARQESKGRGEKRHTRERKRERERDREVTAKRERDKSRRQADATGLRPLSGARRGRRRQQRARFGRAQPHAFPLSPPLPPPPPRRRAVRRA